MEELLKDVDPSAYAWEALEDFDGLSQALDVELCDSLGGKFVGQRQVLLEAIASSKEVLDALYDKSASQLKPELTEWRVEREGKEEVVDLPQVGITAETPGLKESLAWRVDEPAVKIESVDEAKKRIVVTPERFDGKKEPPPVHRREREKPATDPSKPQHVVVLVLENRSFDHMFGKVENSQWDRRADLPPAVPCIWPDPDHDILGVQEVQLNGDRGNFSEKEPTETCPCEKQLQTAGFKVSYNWLLTNNPLPGHYLEHHRKNAGAQPPTQGASSVCSNKPEDIPCIVELAENFAVSDQYHAALAGPTVPNRMLLLTCAVGDGYGNNPGDNVDDSKSGKIEGAMQVAEYWRTMRNNQTIFQRLESCEYLKDKDVDPWRVYYRDTPLSIFLSSLSGRQHGNFVPFLERFKADVQADDLPLFSFIEPRYYDKEGREEYADDQHPPHHVGLGDELVRDIYETLAAKPEVFEKTLFIVTWDEHGGFYDHVVPRTWPKDVVSKSRLRPVGLRVPALFISPRVQKGCVVRAKAVQGKNGFLSHESLAASLSKWYGMLELGNQDRRDVFAADFCHVWNTVRRDDVPSVLPVRESFARAENSAVKPREHALYPNTGIFATAEKYVAEGYLGSIRPKLNSASDKLDAALKKAVPVLEKLTKAGLVPAKLTNQAKEMVENGGIKGIVKVVGNAVVPRMIKAAVKILDAFWTVVTKIRWWWRRRKEEKELREVIRPKLEAERRAALAKEDQEARKTEQEQNLVVAARREREMLEKQRQGEEEEEAIILARKRDKKAKKNKKLDALKKVQK